jgi:hypothetical protein
MAWTLDGCSMPQEPKEAAAAALGGAVKVTPWWLEK